MKIRTVIVISCMALALVSCSDEKKPQKPTVKTAKVLTITKPATTQKRYFPGKVEASDRVNLSFQVGGRIQQFPVKEGDDLKKGALIAKLNPKEFEYNLKQAESKYKLSQVEEKRFAILHKQGHVSTSDFDKKKTDFEVAKADFQQAQKDLADSVLKAPFDGVIVRKYVKLYQQVNPNEHIVSFQDINQVDVRVNLPENVIARIKRQGNYDLNVEFAAVARQTFPVRIKEFSAEADPETQTFDAIFTLPAPKNINILPGMTATLIIDIPISHTDKKVYMIPAAAVFKDQQGASSVWLVDPKTKTIQTHHVTPGNLAGDQIEILAGLKPGDQIVSAGVHFLQSGDKINPISEKR